MTGWCVTENFRRPPRRARQAAVGGAPRHHGPCPRQFGWFIRDHALVERSTSSVCSWWRPGASWRTRLSCPCSPRDQSRVHLREGRHREALRALHEVHARRGHVRQEPREGARPHADDLESVETREAASRCSICFLFVVVTPPSAPAPPALLRSGVGRQRACGTRWLPAAVSGERRARNHSVVGLQKNHCVLCCVSCVVCRLLCPGPPGTSR